MFRIFILTFVLALSPLFGVHAASASNGQLGSEGCVGVNGFLQQINIVSIINKQTTSSLNARVSYLNDGGETVSFVNKLLAPREKWDVIVNDLGLLPDTIGTACVTTDATQDGLWFGGVTIYKPDLRWGMNFFGDAFDYALYYPFEVPLTESIGLGLNTFRFAMPITNGVANWISIYDALPGDSIGVQGELFIYDQFGNELKKYLVEMPDGGRRDYSGHDPIYDSVGLEAIGLALFIPKDSVQGIKFNATVTRYFYDCFSAFCTNFLTAFAMPRSLPTSERLVGAVSTAKSEFTVVEFANVNTNFATATVSIFSQKGLNLNNFNVATTLGATSHLLVLKGGGQGALENNQLGSAEVNFSSGQMAPATVFYHTDKFGRLDYAYATPLSTEPSAQQLTQFNSYIGNQNELELANTSDLLREVRVRVTDSDGNIIWNHDSIPLSARETKRFTLLLPESSYGTISVHSNGTGVFARNIVSKKDSYTLAFNGFSTSGFGNFNEGLLGTYIAKKVRIMPLGDSITESQDKQTPYRYWLEQWLKYYINFEYVGSKFGVFRGTPLYTDFNQRHEGHSGFRSDQIGAGIKKWADQANPDIVLIHLGTNDINQLRSTEGILRSIESIVTQLREKNPLVMVVIAQIIPSDRPGSDRLLDLNKKIPGLAKKLTTPTSPVLVADQFSGYSVKDNFDGLHPGIKGSQKIAGVWLNKIFELLML